MAQIKRSTVLHPPLFLAAIGIGAFLSHFTAGIVNVSLPELTRSFQADIGLVQWITTGYLLVIAVTLPLMGRLGDRYGHQRVHNIGYLFFTISSVLVALSPNLGILLVLRVIQAVGASMFQATNIALITVLLSQEIRGRALGIVSMAVALGGMTGPFAGGVISQWLHWRWLFLIHVPAAVIATYLAFRHIPAVPLKKKVTFDGIGALLFAALTGTVIYGVTRVSSWSWDSAEMWVAGSFALLLFFTFLVRTLRHPNPFLPLQMFQEPAVSSGLFVSFISFLLANSTQVVLPFYLTDWVGIPVLAVGSLMIAYPAALAISGPIAGRLSDTYGSKTFPVIGLLMMGGGALSFALWLEQMSPATIACLLALVGIGMGLIASPNNSMIMSSVSSRHTGAAGGLIALSRNAGMAFGAALGLGAMNVSSTFTVPASSTVYTTVFGWNVFLCLVVILLLVFANQASRAKVTCDSEELDQDDHQPSTHSRMGER